MPLRFEYRPPKINGAAVVSIAAEAAAHAGAEVLLNVTRPNTPRDTGEMAESGKVTPHGHGAAVSYNRVSPEGYDIAVRQHEDMTLDHPGGGEAKWLEKGMHSAHEPIAEAVSVSLRKVIE